MDARAEQGRAAYAREDWTAAWRLLSAADATSSLGADDLERLATVAHLTGRDEAGIAARSRAYQAHLDRGDTVQAARAAFWLAFALIDAGGPGASASGWLARAHRLVEECGVPCAVQGLLAAAAGFEAAARGEFETARARSHEAGVLGTRDRDPDVLALARHGEGRALIRLGRLDEGLALLDEVMVGATMGETSPIVLGVVYCGVIGACHEIFDWQRARDWTAVLATWCDAHPGMVPFRGTCLVRRSEVLQSRGEWNDALDEARRARDWLSRDPRRPGITALAYYQLAELHRLRGALTEAEDAYRQASQAGGRVQPGLALLRLAQGRTDAAAAAIRSAMQETPERRLRPPILRAAVDILLAGGDRRAAMAASDELRQRAHEHDSPWLTALAETAVGTLALAGDDPAAALQPLRRACHAWQTLEVPYEMACVRTLLGQAYRAMGDHDGAALEFDAAQETFESLGAAPDALRLAALASAAPPGRPDRGGLTGREIEVLRQVAAGKTNRAIAAELDISEKTVARHLSNIFTKLDLPSRAAATAYAYEHKLV